MQYKLVLNAMYFGAKRICLATKVHKSGMLRRLKEE